MCVVLIRLAAPGNLRTLACKLSWDWHKSCPNTCCMPIGGNHGAKIRTIIGTAKKSTDFFNGQSQKLGKSCVIPGNLCDYSVYPESVI